jgi:transcriptional regulator with PAS, ATPase and Fis domain
VRIITATNKKLDQLVQQGKFRDDLYYRINLMRLELSPLRNRKEDIPILVDHFINRFNRLHNKNIYCVTNEVTMAHLAYDYPGNVRELENIIEHCFVLCEGKIIEAKQLPKSIRPSSNQNKTKENPPATSILSKENPLKSRCKQHHRIYNLLAK